MCTIILSALNYCWKSMMRLVSDVLLVQIRIYPLCLSNLLVNGDVLQCYWITFFVCGIVSNMFILNPIWVSLLLRMKLVWIYLLICWALGINSILFYSINMYILRIWLICLHKLYCFYIFLVCSSGIPFVKW